MVGTEHAPQMPQESDQGTIWGGAVTAPEPDASRSYAALCQDIRDLTPGKGKATSWVFHQLVADTAAMIGRGEFDGPDQVPERPAR
jgi:hypothetical protein